MLRFSNLKDEVKMQCLKMRDGDPPASFSLETAYHCAYLGEKEDIGHALTSNSFGMNNQLLFNSDPFSS
jgi:hypothetical protein